jgi:hypothetical protein
MPGKCQSDYFTIVASDSAIRGSSRLLVVATRGVDNTNRLPARGFQVDGVKIRKQRPSKKRKSLEAWAKEDFGPRTSGVSYACLFSNEPAPSLDLDLNITLAEDPVVLAIGGRSNLLTFHTNTPATKGPIVLTPTCAELIFAPVSVTVPAGASESEPVRILANTNAPAGAIMLRVLAASGTGNTNYLQSEAVKVRGVQLQEPLPSGTHPSSDHTEVEKKKDKDFHDAGDDAEDVTQVARPDIYSETQVKANCLLHVMNTLLQIPGAWNVANLEEVISRVKQKFLRENGATLQSVGAKMRDAGGNYSIEVLLAIFRINGLQVQRIGQAWKRELSDLDSNTKGFVITNLTHFWSLTPIGGHFYELNSLSPLHKPRIDEATFRDHLATKRAVFHIYAENADVCPFAGCKQHSQEAMVDCTRNQCKRTAGHLHCIESFYAPMSAQTLCRPCARMEAVEADANARTSSSAAVRVDSTLPADQLTDETGDVKSTGSTLTTISLATAIEIVAGGKPTKTISLHADVLAQGGPMILTLTGAELTFSPQSVAIPVGTSKSEPFTIQASSNALAGDTEICVAASSDASNTNDLSTVLYKTTGIHVSFHPEKFIGFQERKTIRDENNKPLRVDCYLVQWLGCPGQDTWEPAHQFDNDPHFQEMLERDGHLWKPKHPQPPDLSFASSAPQPSRAAGANPTDPSSQPTLDSNPAMPTPPALVAAELKNTEMKETITSEETMWKNISTRAASRALQADNARSPTAMRTRARSNGSISMRTKPPTSSATHSALARSMSAGNTVRGLPAGDDDTSAGAEESNSQEHGSLFGLLP